MGYNLSFFGLVSVYILDRFDFLPEGPHFCTFLLSAFWFCDRGYLRIDKLL